MARLTSARSSDSGGEVEVVSTRSRQSLSNAKRDASADEQAQDDGGAKGSNEDEEEYEIEEILEARRGAFPKVCDFTLCCTAL